MVKKLIRAQTEEFKKRKFKTFSLLTTVNCVFPWEMLNYKLHAQGGLTPAAVALPMR